MAKIEKPAIGNPAMVVHFGVASALRLAFYGSAGLKPGAPCASAIPAIEFTKQAPTIRMYFSSIKESWDRHIS